LASAAKPAAATRQSPLPLFIAVLLIPAVLGSSKTIFNDGDVSWHIATGQWILDHQAIPHADPFSFTWAGKSWVPIEWLAEVFYAAVYRLDGYAGIAALVTGALILLHALVFFAARRGWGALIGIVLMDLVLIPMMLARPHLLAWPLIAGWTWLMLRAREQDRAPPIAAALLMTVWANLHGSFIMGLAIAGFFGLEALVMSVWFALRQSSSTETGSTASFTRCAFRSCKCSPSSMSGNPLRSVSRPTSLQSSV
jgi:hypothetical protein